jgi:alkylated DNA repair dioxygenase AlkB
VEPSAATDTWLVADPVVERVDLAPSSWVDVVRGLLPDGDRVHDELLTSVTWEQGKVFRYERWVGEPRLSSYQRTARAHPALQAVQAWISARYHVTFEGVALAHYRDERDSVAWHRDRELRYLDDTVIGVLSLGARRPWLLRPLTDRRAEADEMTGVLDARPSSGDLLVMGGRAQAEWLHAVPKQQARTGSRISAQWRYTSRRGRRDNNPGYYAPRHYSNG